MTSQSEKGFPVQAYTILSKVYDRWNSGLDHQRMASFIESKAICATKSKVKVLDLCCGTGSLIQILSSRGMDVAGIDNSPEMLMIARKKLAQYKRSENLILGDIMSECWPDEAFEVISCTSDSINYLPQAKLEKLFERCYSSLKTGGLFIFDVNSTYKLRRIFGNTRYAEVFDDYSYIWQNRIDAESNKIVFDITLFIAKDNNPTEYTRYKEVHTQYIYHHKWLMKKLAMTGFTDITTVEDYSDKAVTARSLRITYSSRRGEF